MSDWQTWQYQDELNRQEKTEEIIFASASRPLTEEERIYIAIETGVYRAKEKK